MKAGGFTMNPPASVILQGIGYRIGSDVGYGVLEGEFGSDLVFVA